MRFIRCLLLITMQVLLIAAGIWHFFYGHPVFNQIFARWVYPPADANAFDWRPSPLGIDIFWSLVMVLPAVYWLVSLLVYRKNHGTLNVHTSSGDTIQFQLGAIEEFVRAQVKAHPGVSSHSVHVKQERNGAISVNLGIKVKPIDSVPEIHRQVKEILRDGIVNVLGIDNIGTINVEIKRVLGSPRRTSGPLAPARPAPEAPIRATQEEMHLAEETHRLDFKETPPPASVFENDVELTPDPELVKQRELAAKKEETSL